MSRPALPTVTRPDVAGLYLSGRDDREATSTRAVAAKSISLGAGHPGGRKGPRLACPDGIAATNGKATRAVAAGPGEIAVFSLACARLAAPLVRRRMGCSDYARRDARVIRRRLLADLDAMPDSADG